MFQFCFFLSMAFSYCVQTQPVPVIYPDVVNRATEMIVRYEGFSPTAYKDSHGLYSIGYGTRSYEGEVITQPEAYARMQRVVSQSVNRVMEDFPNADSNQIIALTSLFYNCWSGYLRVEKNGLQIMHEPNFCQMPGNGWLVRRRAEERKLVFGE